MTQSNEIQMVKETTAVPVENHQKLELPSPNIQTKVLETQSSSEKTKQKNTELAWESRKEEVQKLVEELNDHYQVRGTNLNFSIDDDTKSLVVRVLDKEDNKIIRQIPTDEILELKKHIKNFIGTLIDETA